MSVEHNAQNIISKEKARSMGALQAAVGAICMFVGISLASAQSGGPVAPSAWSNPGFTGGPISRDQARPFQGPRGDVTVTDSGPTGDWRRRRLPPVPARIEAWSVDRMPNYVEVPAASPQPGVKLNLR